MRSRLVDLSHPIEAGMTTYPGLPGPAITDHLSREASRGHYAAGTTFQIGRIEMVANTGTYIDAPFHRYAEGDDLAALPLERLRQAEDSYVDELYGEGPSLGATLLAARFPRSYIDPNRSLLDIDASLLEGPWPGPATQCPATAWTSSSTRRASTSWRRPRSA